MSDLGFNKIAGAVLATGLAIVGLNELSAILFEIEKPEKPGYDVPVIEAEGPGGPVVDVPPDWGTVLPVADVAAGQAVFAKCQSCHKPTDENGTGPGLNALVGRKPAAHGGFTFSAAMTDFAGKQPVWDYEHLYEYLKAPAKYVPGTKMTFAGLKKRDDRINVIAYLHTLNSSLPVPAPDPAAAAAPAEGAAPAGPAEAGKPTATGSTAQAGQPAQAPTTGAAAAPTQLKQTGGGH